MHYLLGGLSVLILIMALPPKTLMAIAIYLVVSAVIVKFIASLLTKTEMPFSKSIKAVAYSLFFSIIALGAIFVFAPAIFILGPILLFCAHTLGYSIALEVPFVGSAVISLCVLAIGWGIMFAFGLSSVALTQLIS
jgi:hypothetical protein